MDGSVTETVPCGKCPPCIKTHSKGWVFRLQQESKDHQTELFLNLTYDEKHVPKNKYGINTLRKKDLQLFWKRLRKRLHDHYGDKYKFKYYACGEYGTQTNRPHYHAVIFGLPKLMCVDPQEITDIWGKGHIVLGSVTGGSIAYVTQYVHKKAIKGFENVYEQLIKTNKHGWRIKGCEPEFSAMSKKLGLNYITPAMIKYHRENLAAYCTLDGGIKTSMPRYYRDKIFLFKPDGTPDWEGREKYKLIQEANAEARALDFEKLFNSDHKKYHEWELNQRRIHKKKHNLNRVTI